MPKPSSAHHFFNRDAPYWKQTLPTAINLRFHSIDGLRQHYQTEISSTWEGFERSADGVKAVRRRAHLVDQLIAHFWMLLGGPGASTGVALMALGGFGRKELFPYSDVDLLYLCADERAERDFKSSIRAANQAMWDLGLRASPAIRSLKECERYQADNLEFTLSLLDRRFLAGDITLSQALEEQVLPSLISREWVTIAHRIAELSRTRHRKYGDTIFHLEPNIKECPGGLRDYHLAHWLNLLHYIRQHKSWPAAYADPLYAASDAEARAAFDFLSASRCFLHLRSGRDNNKLDWQAQDEAAKRSIGLESTGSSDPAYWMRTYFRHARIVHRRAILLIDALPPARHSFYRHFRWRRAVVPGTDFMLEDGRIDISGSSLSSSAEDVLKVFTVMATHGYRLTRQAESRLAGALPVLDLQLPEGPLLWDALRAILTGSHAAHALRTLHALGILELLIPEFHGIDALVIRDTYHRYTVDEHTFLVIENVHALRQPHSPWEQHFQSLLEEVERPDLFFLALLMHDTGKGRQGAEHATESAELAGQLMLRLGLEAEEREIVQRLIRDHLEMSLALRRDIFDPEAIRSFAARAGSPANLKMLCLMTYADVKSVNPDALTPWKTESLWQLYIAASNFMDRSVDEERFHSAVDPGLLQSIEALSPDCAEGLAVFLEGLPQRYFRTRQPKQIHDHFLMSLRLAALQGTDGATAQIAVRPLRRIYELTLVTRDRPLLFVDVAGALSAWGMNIVKAEAFSGEAGIIVDTFEFSDPFRTLELNPSERERFEQYLRDVLDHRVSVEEQLRRRETHRAPAMVQVETSLEFDNRSSSHSTLLQVVAQDGPGLLRQIAAALASRNCDIRVALIDTEGEMAIDVFYLTNGGAKLNENLQQDLGQAVKAAIEELPSARMPR